jgi:hypothetical protein
MKGGGETVGPVVIVGWPEVLGVVVVVVKLRGTKSSWSCRCGKLSNGGITHHGREKVHECYVDAKRESTESTQEIGWF